MLGCWIRPWRGETLCGVVVAVSGERLICRSPGGFQFEVLLADVKARKAEVWRADNLGRGWRLTESPSGQMPVLLS